MDALNRHLRSEGGAECLRMQEANGTLPPGFSASSPDSNGNGRSYDNKPAALPVPLVTNKDRTKQEDMWGTGGIGGGGIGLSVTL